MSIFSGPEEHIHSWNKWVDDVIETKFTSNEEYRRGNTTTWNEKVTYQIRRCSSCNLMDRIRIGHREAYGK